MKKNNRFSALGSRDLKFGMNVLHTFIKVYPNQSKMGDVGTLKLIYKIQNLIVCFLPRTTQPNSMRFSKIFRKTFQNDYTLFTS